MHVSREDLSRRYASRTDVELLEMDPGELTELARQCYDAEMERRGLHRVQVIPPFPVAEDWRLTAVAAVSFRVDAAQRYSEDAEYARRLLLDAGIPCEVAGTYDEEAGGPDMINLLVPSGLTLRAQSIIDLQLFNEELEQVWKVHFEQLSDRELRALNPDDLCAGLLDRAARLKRAYEEALRSR